MRTGGAVSCMKVVVAPAGSQVLLFFNFPCGLPAYFLGKSDCFGARKTNSEEESQELSLPTYVPLKIEYVTPCNSSAGNPHNHALRQSREYQSCRPP